MKTRFLLLERRRARTRVGEILNQQMVTSSKLCWVLFHAESFLLWKIKSSFWMAKNLPLYNNTAANYNLTKQCANLRFPPKMRTQNQQCAPTRWKVVCSKGPTCKALFHTWATLNAGDSVAILWHVFGRQQQSCVCLRSFKKCACAWIILEFTLIYFVYFYFFASDVLIVLQIRYLFISFISGLLTILSWICLHKWQQFCAVLTPDRRDADRVVKIGIQKPAEGSLPQAVSRVQVDDWVCVSPLASLNY